MFDCDQESPTKLKGNQGFEKVSATRGEEAYGLGGRSGKSWARKVRKISGFHDEPLKGKRKGQRSIRLSKAYRAIYTINDQKEVEFVEIQEVSKHDY